MLSAEFSVSGYKFNSQKINFLGEISDDNRFLSAVKTKHKYFPNVLTLNIMIMILHAFDHADNRDSLILDDWGDSSEFWIVSIPCS
jgi:hypothetical protein